jgi:Uma2 family endonuclease
VTQPAKKPASYADVLAAPEHMIAELIDGELRLQPRRAIPHSAVSSALGYELGPPFDRGRGGPGGWLLLDEPELHLGADIIVPNLGGWRVERVGPRGDVPYLTIAADWICEVLSPRTLKYDRSDKLRIYAREQVHWAWLVEPLQRTLEIFRLESGRWVLLGTWKDDDVLRAEPFDAIELELAAFWRHVPPPDAG